MTFVRGSKLRTERQTVITETEFEEALYQASQIEDEFLRLRASAVLCLLRLTGKRRAEIAILPVGNLKVEKGFLKATFILEKKRKGHGLLKQSVKSIPLTEPLTEHILTYLEYLNKREPKALFFVPRVKAVFGHNVIMADAHISGRQVFNIVRNLSESIWPHLFRETVGSDVIKKDPTIIGAFKVMRRLDLEDYRTGFSYLKRFAADVIRKEEEKLKQKA